MKTISISLCLMMALAFSGCASMDSRTKCILKGAAVGAAIGAGSGAVIGHQGDTDNDTEGSLIGAAAGGIVGGAIGYFYCKADEVLDSDNDGIPDDTDKCPGTPPGVKVDSNGCPLDSDGDGVYDYKDNCPGTPKGVKVDDKGCPPDSDGDGVPDHRDKCPNTPADTKVDNDGCPLDSDGDGVYDHEDQCPRTPKGAAVDQRGCWVLKGVNFDTNKADIKPGSYQVLDDAVSVLKKNPELTLEVQGHTDNRGSAEYNQQLSERRAKSVVDYFVSKGIEKDRLKGVGYGLTKPAASNDTPEGRAQNRRVELKPIY